MDPHDGCCPPGATKWVNYHYVKSHHRRCWHLGVHTDSPSSDLVVPKTECHSQPRGKTSQGWRKRKAWELGGPGDFALLTFVMQVTDLAVFC